MTKYKWQIAYASVIGTSHMKRGAPCQDNGNCGVVLDASGKEILLAAVSDGAGSAISSEIGSQLTVEYFHSYFTQILQTNQFHELDKYFITNWVTDLNLKIKNIAQEKNLHPSDFACTLLAVIVSQDAAIFLQIGDGAIVVSEQDNNEYGYIFWPQHGEFANQTNFVTYDNVENFLQFEYINRTFESIILFTDGIERLILDFSSKKVHAPALEPIVKWLKHDFPCKVSASTALISYLSSDYINNRTDDDKTLVIATRIPYAQTTTN